MKNIGEMVERIKARTGSPNPDGGIGGLTVEELAPINDLLNAAQPCQCVVCTRPKSIVNPDRKPGV